MAIRKPTSRYGPGPVRSNDGQEPQSNTQQQQRESGGKLNRLRPKPNQESRDAMDPEFRRHNVDSTTPPAPEEWLVPASDRSKGFARLPSIQIPPSMLFAMERMIASKKFVYEVLPDLVRHALARHLEWLTQQNDKTGMEDVIVLMRNMTALNHHQVLNREAHATLARLENTMERLVQAGDYAQAYRFGLEITKNIAMMPTSNTKNKFTRRFNARYGEFVRSHGHTKPDAGLGPIVTEQDFLGDGDGGSGDGFGLGSKGTEEWPIQ